MPIPPPPVVEVRKGPLTTCSKRGARAHARTRKYRRWGETWRPICAECLKSLKGRTEVIESGEPLGQY